jgi:hypothetical protein
MIQRSLVPIGRATSLFVRGVVASAALGLAADAGGRATPAGNATLVNGGMAYACQAPTNEFEQVHYLGAFDSQEQVSPSVYRLSVRSQTSSLSFTRFASGWVPANMVDTLNTTFTFKVKRGRPGGGRQRGHRPRRRQPPDGPPTDHLRARGVP